MTGPTYHIKHDLRAKPFLVTKIRSDGKYTYIHSLEQEKAALYEEKDGKANLVQYEFRNGVYKVPKVLGTGYLKIGKKKGSFTKEG